MTVFCPLGFEVAIEDYLADRRQVIDRSAAASRAAVQAIALRADRDRWFKAAVVRPATRP